MSVPKLYNTRRMKAVFTEGKSGAVEHDGGVAGLNTALGYFITFAVIEVQRHRRLHLLGCGASHRDYQPQTQVLDGRFGGLQNDRCAKGICCPDVCEQRFRVIKVESCHSTSRPLRGIEQRTASYQLSRSLIVGP